MATIDPVAVVEGKAAGSDYAVDMRVQEILPCPCVEDGGCSDTKAESLGTGQQGIGGGREKKLVDFPRMRKCEGPELRLKSCNDVVVADGKDAIGALGNPLGLGEGLAIRAAPVVAGIVPGLFEATVGIGTSV